VIARNNHESGRLVFPIKLKFKLRTKIIAWSFIPTAIILLLVASTIYVAYQQTTALVILKQDEELTRLSGSEISANLQDFIDRLSNLGNLSEVSEGVPQQQRKALIEWKNKLVIFDSGVYILNNLGRVVAAEPELPLLVGQDWSKRSFFTSQVRNPTLFFSNIESEGPQGERVISLAVPIKDRAGAFKGVAVGMFHLDARAVSPFYGTLIKLRIGQQGAAYLVDGNNQVLYSTNSAYIGRAFPVHPATTPDKHGQVGAIRTHSFDGKDIVAGYAPVPRTHWTLIVERDWGDVIRAGQDYQRFLLLLLALGVIVPTVVVMFGVRRITGPIGDFIAAAQRIAGGDFRQSINIDTGDELEELANQFNAMAIHLQESYETLEARVQQRTQELSALNSLAAVVSRSLDLDQILPDALQMTIEVLGMDSGAVFRFDEETGTPHLVAKQGISEDLIDLSSSMPVGLSIIQRVVETKHPVARLVTEYPPGPMRDVLERDGWQTIVSIPLVAQEKVLGAINVTSRLAVMLSPEDMAVPAAIGQQIGVAIDNARLYNQTVEYARRLEIERQAAETARTTAEAANAAKSDFLANVSHELRTPLASITGFARLVQKRMEERVIPLLPKEGDGRTERAVNQIEDNLHIILTEGQRLTTMINTLLDLEKIESGNMEWQFRSLSMPEVIKQATAATAGLFEGKNLSLLVEYPDHLPRVMGDQEKLMQVLINLISNAVKFTKVGQVTVRAKYDNKNVTISVSDQGMGIAATDQQRLFEKFTQVGDPLTEKPQGTGLGLAISKEIVERHGGRIWVESEEGRGSTFSFAIPVLRRESKEDSTRLQTAKETRP
jgi:signal transduction histidine kinase